MYEIMLVYLVFVAKASMHVKKVYTSSFQFEVENCLGDSVPQSSFYDYFFWLGVIYRIK